MQFVLELAEAAWRREGEALEGEGGRGSVVRGGLVLGLAEQFAFEAR
jgi:hypothetical protein